MSASDPKLTFTSTSERAMTAASYNQPDGGPILPVRRLAPIRSPCEKHLAVRQVATFEGFRVLVIFDARRCDVGVPVGPNPIKYEQTDC